MQKNFNSVLLKNFSDCADLPAMMFKDEGTFRTITYGDLGDVCMSVASGLMKIGVKRGDRVVIFSNNRPQWAYADLGSILAGAITSAIYASALSDEAEFIISDLAASVVFVEDTPQLEKIISFRNRIPTVKNVIVFADTFSGYDPWIMPFSDLMEAGGPSPAVVGEVREIADFTGSGDTMCVIYTSGTTGRPKGVVLTHGNYIDTAEILLEHIAQTERLKRNLSILPLAHAFERFAGHYLILYMGRCIAYIESLEKIMDNFREVKPNIVVAVPRFFENVHKRIIEGVESASPVKRKLFYWALNVGYRVSRRTTSGESIPWTLALEREVADVLVFRKFKEAFGGELEFFASGGAPLGKELAEFFHALGILILEGWGATEATTPSTFNRPEEFKFGTVGKPLPRVQVRLNEEGELEVKGPNVFKEYWKNPEETDLTFTPDGFYRSGDIGVIDDDGWVTIVDRKKQLIITSGGRNIAPAPIEQLLVNGRYIDMAYVHGDRQHYLTALIVPDRNTVNEEAKRMGMDMLSWPELIKQSRIIEQVQREIDHANGQLPPFMRIRDFRILPGTFSVEGGEMTHTMKLKRKIIQEKNRDLLADMYQGNIPPQGGAA